MLFTKEFSGKCYEFVNCDAKNLTFRRGQDTIILALQVNECQAAADSLYARPTIALPSEILQESAVAYMMQGRMDGYETKHIYRKIRI